MNTDLEAKADEVRSAGQVRDVGAASATTQPVFSGLHAKITERVLSVYFEVYNELGGGFLESVYQQALRIALLQVGLQVLSEVAVPVYFRGQLVGTFRADLVVDGCVLLELKAVTGLDKEHDGQIVHYLRATDYEVGLLLNFGPKPQFRRFILENGSKKFRVYPRPSAVSLSGSRT